MPPRPYFHLTFPTLGLSDQPNKVSYLLTALDTRITQREVLRGYTDGAKPHERNPLAQLALDRDHLSATVCNSVTAVLSPRVLPHLPQASPLEPPAWEAVHPTLTGWPRLLLCRENRGNQERPPSPSCLRLQLHTCAPSFLQSSCPRERCSSGPPHPHLPKSLAPRSDSLLCLCPLP